MTENIKDKSPANPNMLSIEQLRLYPGNENKSDDELIEQAEFLKEFSLIIYAAFVNNQNDIKSEF